MIFPPPFLPMIERVMIQASLESLFLVDHFGPDLNFTPLSLNGTKASHRTFNQKDLIRMLHTLFVNLFS